MPPRKSSTEKAYDPSRDSFLRRRSDEPRVDASSAEQRDSRVSWCGSREQRCSSVQALVWLVTRPDAIADQVRAGAESIPLKGYVVPSIESIVGPGAWVALVAGVLLTLVGLVGVVVPSWRRRRTAVTG